MKSRHVCRRPTIRDGRLIFPSRPQSQSLTRSHTPIAIIIKSNSRILVLGEWLRFISCRRKSCTSKAHANEDSANAISEALLEPGMGRHMYGAPKVSSNMGHGSETRALLTSMMRRRLRWNSCAEVLFRTWYKVNAPLRAVESPSHHTFFLAHNGRNSLIEYKRHGGGGIHELPIQLPVMFRFGRNASRTTALWRVLTFDNSYCGGTARSTWKKKDRMNSATNATRKLDRVRKCLAYER